MDETKEGELTSVWDAKGMEDVVGFVLHDHVLDDGWTGCLETERELLDP